MTEDVFEFETRERDGRAIVRLMGELDMGEVEALQEELDRVCSNGLHLLIKLRGHCASQQLPLTLVPGPPAVQRLFQLTGTDGQFTFVERRPQPAP